MRAKNPRNYKNIIVIAAFDDYYTGLMLDKGYAPMLIGRIGFLPAVGVYEPLRLRLMGRVDDVSAIPFFGIPSVIGGK
jgi:hypothetical protein